MTFNKPQITALARMCADSHRYRNKFNHALYDARHELLQLLQEDNSKLTSDEFEKQVQSYIRRPSPPSEPPASFLLCQTTGKEIPIGTCPRPLAEQLLSVFAIMFPKAEVFKVSYFAQVRLGSVHYRTRTKGHSIKFEIEGDEIEFTKKDGSKMVAKLSLATVASDDRLDPVEFQ